MRQIRGDMNFERCGEALEIELGPVAEFQFPSLVVDVAAIYDLLSPLTGSGEWIGDRQNVRRPLAIDVERTLEATSEHGEIHAKIQLPRRLPLEVWVPRRRLRKTRRQRATVVAVEVIGSARLLLAAREIGKQRGRGVTRRKDRRACGSADLLIAVGAEARPEFQVVDEIDLKKRFLRKTPAYGRRREITPAVVGTESGRTVSAHRE